MQRNLLDTHASIPRGARKEAAAAKKNAQAGHERRSD